MRFRLSPAAYRRIVFVAAVLLGIIIVSGGAVRLTGSGLGCPDWPNCHPGSLVPKGESDGHAMVEFLNRVFTGAVSIAVIVCVLGSLIRRPRRRDLLWLSWGLVIGVFAQAVLGGLTVLFELQPQFVMSHFLLSLVLLTDAVVLYSRAGEANVPGELVVTPRVRNLGRALVVLAGIVVFAGTVVTSTGPHGGDEEAKRFDFELSHVARVHGISVVCFLALALVILALLRRTKAPESVQSRLGAVLLASCVQAAIGYIQYFNDSPPLLVGLHIAGATIVWTTVVWFFLGLTRRPAEVVDPVPAVPANTPGVLA